MNKETQIRRTAMVLASAAFAAAWEIKRELGGFVVSQHKVYIPRTSIRQERARLLFLSDLHGKCYGKGNQELISAIKREEPDLILIGGDLLTRSEGATDATAMSLLTSLAELCPIYMANGNHEQKLREYANRYGRRYKIYRAYAKNLGVHLLENESQTLEVRGNSLRISGLEIPLECYGQFSRRQLKTEEIVQRIGAAQEGAYQILLAHNPAYMEQYLEWGADLTLSGHLHGGIVRIPGIGGVITPQAKLFPKYSGDLYRKGDQTCIVSRGLGTHTVNVRLFNQAEVVRIDLIPGTPPLGKPFPERK